MTKGGFDIVTIGDCVLDHYLKLDERGLMRGSGSKSGRLVLAYSQKIPLQAFLFFPGGNSLNTAVSFSRLGLKTAIHTHLGTGHDGDFLYQRIVSEKVDPRFVIRNHSLDTDKSVILITRGDRTILSYHSRKPYHLPKFDSKWVYLTSLGAGYQTLYRQTIEFCKRTGTKLAFNPGSRQLKDSISQIRKVIQVSDLVCVNQEEAQMITGLKTADVGKLLLAMHKVGAKKVAITQGIKGSSGYDGVSRFRVGSFPAVRVDATGAGDAFASGAVAALVSGKTLDQAILWGSVNAASEVAQVGVQNGLLTKKEILKRLKAHPNFKARKF